MSFRRLQEISAARKKLLPFVRSQEDSDLLIAIGIANEEGTFLGLKQLQLLNIASPSTVDRRIRTLVAKRAIKKSLQRGDGRRVVYTLTAKTRMAFNAYLALLRKIA
ncbi:MAG: hypothetical protein K9J42_13970 [Sulfuritalea sp.]|nr:hypothetical protein [Sulfuritalea sp.]